MENNKATTIDEYISSSPESTRLLLQQMRATISKAVPEAGEKISYQMPAFTLAGNLVHFAAYKHHIGFYPGAGAIIKFNKELSAYELSKGTVRFPLDKPLPVELIAKIAQYLAQENLRKVKLKAG